MTEYSYPLLHNRTYKNLRHEIARAGRKSAPRDLPILELLGKVAWFYAGEIVGRVGLNPKLGFTEGLALVAGLADESWIRAAAPSVDLSLYGSFAYYGPMAAGQYEGVLDELRRDPDSRRAVIVLAGSNDLTSTGLPCTLALQFFIRNGDLYTLAHMRSSDSVLGVPYDVMQFSMLALCVARVLRVRAFAVGLSMGSSHTYIGARSEDLHSFPESKYFGLMDSVPTDWPGVVGWAKGNLDQQAGWLPSRLPDGVVMLRGPGGRHL